MRLKIFIEYRIKAGESQEFETMLPQQAERMARLGVERYAVYTGVDQPHLYVEEGFVSELDRFDIVKKALLLPEDALGEQFLARIDGGPSKLHIWAFRPVS